MSEGSDAASGGPQSTPAPTPSPVPGLDPAVANQITLLSLTNALNQQQLNAAAARGQLANCANVLTLGVQLTQVAAIGQIFHLSPIGAAAATQLDQAGNISKLASLQTASRAPSGA